MNRSFALAAVVVLLAACDGGTGPGSGGKVAVKFGAGTTSRISANLVTSGDPQVTADQLTLTGTNGTLVLQDVRFIVEQMKLRSSRERR